ncbi:MULTISPECIES: aminopeptidase [unclassified Fusibacter]|uniref:aminopeptidase n=1 Tax=unclassified Fusibacter TaxID=2624464 RepID=UPI00101277D1|nr:MULTISPECIES: aminopeptidase [unclassified Fusibacter]MCK8058222.1 aminopeptidase [Fusibacter sp. A2]NPE20805.1 aminopeptidase [Fusibacter sp. A1]RXV63009.1 aminopeptidase [Fusibacter sp. A1]
MEKLKRNYADLLVRKGVNLKVGQYLVVSSPVECFDFARIVAEAGYDAGAREVIIDYQDEQIFKMKFEKASDEVFDTYEDWRTSLNDHYLLEDAAFIILDANTPGLFEDIDRSRMNRLGAVAFPKLSNYRTSLMNNKVTWCIASMPTLSWANKVFPNEVEPINRLWDVILKSVRVEEDDFLAKWDEHIDNLNETAAKLNEIQFKRLHIKNSIGTDIKVELPVDHIWKSTQSETVQGRRFIANIPSEEVYTAPDKHGVNGKVVATKPLIYNGGIIDDFYLIFKNGQVIEAKAKQGNDLLSALVNTDEGARFLGEVAILPNDTPLSNQNFLFHNTLYDENTGSHFALGQASLESTKNGKQMSEEQLNAHGINQSKVKANFTFTTADLSIHGVDKDGEIIEILKEARIVLN